MAEPHEHGPPRRADMRDVAEVAGVSTATVSRVLSGSGYASPETRVRVTEAAARLGYRLDALARGLRRRQSMALGVLVQDLSNPVALSFIRGVQHVAQLSGYAVVIADAQRNAAVERRQIELFQSQRVAAIIVAGLMQDPKALSSLSLGDSPLVISPDTSPGAADAESPAIDEAVADLARRGHRLVLFASRAPASDSTAPPSLTEARRGTVRDSCARLGLRMEQCALPVELPKEALVVRLRDALGSPDGPRALICASHGLAPPILGALAGMGWAIPRQISFITFGDSEWAVAYRPALSVIRLDRYQHARRITHDLLVRLGNSPEPEVAAGNPEYVVRESVGDDTGSGDAP
jgi:LacI family transcriptional regulator